MFFFFFFSSRRRHTRCSRDWSSDVCSSDLVGLKRLKAHFSWPWPRGRSARRRTTTWETRSGIWARKRKRSEEHTSELQSRLHLVCRLLLEKKKKTEKRNTSDLDYNRDTTDR